MTSTSFNVGLNSSTRNSSKVLKPPGGGSSDIFGSSGESNEPQRKVKNHLSSSIFTSEETVSHSRSKAGNDSFNNLFGSEPHRPISSPSKTRQNQFKSTIIHGDESFPKSNAIAAKKSLHFIDNESPDNTKSSNGDLPETAPCNSNGSFRFQETPTSSSQSSKQMLGLTSGVSTSTSDTIQVSADSAVNGASSSTNSSTAASTPAPTPSAPAPTPSAGKPRVPPGGFSSGLW